MRKTGAIELMIWIGKPRPIRSPMLQTMLIMASIMRVMDRKRSLNIRYLTKSMTIPAIGAKMAIS